MGLFVQILLAVFVVIVFLLLVAYGLLRLWLKRTSAHYEQVHELLDDPYRPARLVLWSCEYEGIAPGLKQAWALWYEHGFRKAGDFTSDCTDCQCIRLAIHPDHKLGLLLCEAGDNGIHAVVMGITQDKQVHVSSTGLGRPLKTRAVNWSVDPNLAPGEQIDQVLDSTTKHRLHLPTRRLLKSAFEQAWARLMDLELAEGPPSRQTIAERVSKKDPGIDNSLIDETHDQAIINWRDRLHGAVLDNWQRKSKIEAVEWERLQDRIIIIDDHMRANDLRNWLDSDAFSERLIEQFSRQGLAGIALFEAIQERMPRQRRHSCLARFSKPVRTAIFCLDESDDLTLDIGAQAYPFVAVDEDGNKVEEVVLAKSSKDAYRQIRDMGLHDISIINEPNPGEMPSDDLLDPKLAAVGVRAMREPLSVSLFRAMASNSWIWLPPLVLLAWSLYRGQPYSWGDWLIFTYAGLAALFMVFVAGPLLFYNQLQVASIRGRFRTAEIYLKLMRLTCRLLPLPPGTLLLEECKLAAARGKVDIALRRWQDREADMEPDAWLSGLSQIHDQAGDFDQVIRVQQQLVDISGEKDVPRIDLALSLARFKRDPDRAEDLIAGLDITSMSGLALAGFHYVRGMILAERGQHAAALNQYQQAVSHVAQFRGSPLASLLIGEVNGYAALSMRACGEREKALALWQSAWPLIQICTSSQVLIQRWRGPEPDLDLDQDGMAK
jgi:tetratricopeptide (TPR) repeat protein